MRKILLILFVALTFVACEKEERLYGTKGLRVYYKIGSDGFPQFPHLDIVNGDKDSFWTSHTAYVQTIQLSGYDPSDYVEYKFKEDEKVIDLEMATIKTLDNQVFEITAKPTPDCKYKAMGIILDTTPTIENFSKGSIAVFFDK